MIQILELAEKNFKITVIDMWKTIEEKMGKMSFKVKNSNN